MGLNVMDDEKKFILLEMLPFNRCVLFKLFLEGKIILRKSDSKFIEGEIINIHHRSGLKFSCEGKEYRIISEHQIYSNEQMNLYSKRLQDDLPNVEIKDFL